jgi:hypothetical protein
MHIQIHMNVTYMRGVGLCFESGSYRIMAGAEPTHSCRRPRKELQILFLSGECTFSSLNVIVNNLGHFQLS